MTVLEVLLGAHINLVTNKGNALAFMIGADQLANAIRQLESNPDANAEFIEE